MTAIAALRGIPGPSLLEAVSTFLRTPNACDFVLETSRRYGEAYQIPGGDRPVVVLGAEAHFQDVLVRSQRKFTKDHTLRPMELLCRKSLLYPGPEERRRYQAVFTPPLSTRDVRLHQERLADLIKRACDSLDRRFLGGVGVELEEVMLDLHYRVMMSFYLGQAVEQPLAGMGERFAWLARKLPTVWNTRFLPTPAGFRARRSIRDLRARLGAIVAARRSLPCPDDGSIDLAAMCGAFDAAEVTEHLLVLLFASINIPFALTNGLHCVVSHPAVSERLVEESTSGRGDRSAIQAALDESLRLYPVSSLILRDASEEHVVDGHAIPRGSIVILPTIVLNRSASRWEDPLAFRPERFAGDEARPDHYAYGLGPRYCIGAGYSQVAMPLLLERFLATFRVELLEAVPTISNSLPLSLRSTRVRLSAR